MIPAGEAVAFTRVIQANARFEARMNVTEEQISALVHRFYDAARADENLVPVFAVAVTDWDSHVETVADFWSHVLLGAARYMLFPFTSIFPSS